MLITGRVQRRVLRLKRKQYEAGHPDFAQATFREMIEITRLLLALNEG